jgi:hypothetical protein
MNDFLLLMHTDVVDEKLAADATFWGAYLNALRASGQFDGGSSIGTGRCFRKAGSAASRTDALSGYIRVRAADIDDARRYLYGNPVFEAGGTVEIRELPRD